LLYPLLTIELRAGVDAEMNAATAALETALVGLPSRQADLAKHGMEKLGDYFGAGGKDVGGRVYNAPL
jgi:hypothetical protein